MTRKQLRQKWKAVKLAETVEHGKKQGRTNYELQRCGDRFGAHLARAVMGSRWAAVYDDEMTNAEFAEYYYAGALYSLGPETK